MTDRIATFVCRTLARAMSVEPDAIVAQTALNDLPFWDSLAALEVLITIEAEYGVTLDPVALYTAGTPNGIAALIQSADLGTQHVDAV